jgi:hypothetical protein
MGHPPTNKINETSISSHHSTRVVTLGARVTRHVILSPGDHAAMDNITVRRSCFGVFWHVIGNLVSMMVKWLIKVPTSTSRLLVLDLFCCCKR